MPKQISTIQIRGKHNGASYYCVKGHQGGFYRGINPNMSERVKTESGYENTRRYASEFGHVQEWLRAYAYEAPIAQLKSGKRSLRSIIADRLLSTLHHVTGTQVGKRTLPTSGWQLPIETMVNNVTERLFVDDLKSALELEQTYIPESRLLNVAWTIRTTADMFADWRKRGATHMMLKIEGVNLRSAHYNNITGEVIWGYDAATGLYLPVSRFAHQMYYGFVELGAERTIGGEYDFDIPEGEIEGAAGYTFDRAESTFFVRMEVTPTIGVRPNYTPLAGAKFVHLFPFNTSFNV